MDEAWEQRPNGYYLRAGDWEYQIVKTDIGWQQYEKRVNDERWDLICTTSTLQECMDAQ